MSIEIKGGVGHKRVGSQPVGRGRELLVKTVTADITSTAPLFTQAIVADWTENHEGDITNTGRAFSQSAAATLTEYTVTADIDSIGRAFSQDAAGTISQKTVTGDIANTRFAFSQFATSVENPPTVGQIANTAPLFVTNIDAEITFETKTGDIATLGRRFSQKARGVLSEIILGDITSGYSAYRFSSDMVGTAGTVTLEGTITSSGALFTSSLDGTAGNVTLTADITSFGRPFSQTSQANQSRDAISGSIVQNSTNFTASALGTIENKAATANITSNAPAFTQNIDAQYVISSSEGDIVSVLPRFYTNASVNIDKSRIVSIAPRFKQRVRGLRTSNANLYDVVEPLTVTTIGTLVDDDPIPDTYDVFDNLEIDRTTAITMDRQTSAITINTNIIINVDFRQKLTTNINQTIQEMNYVSN